MNDLINQLTNVMMTMVVMRTGMGMVAPVLPQAVSPFKDKVVLIRRLLHDIRRSYPDNLELASVITRIDSELDVVDQELSGWIPQRAQTDRSSELGTVMQSLDKSIAEEYLAMAAYNQRAGEARALNYEDVAKLYEHIKDEEKHHVSEFEKKASEIIRRS